MQLKAHKFFTRKGAYALFCVLISFNFNSFSQTIPNLINNYSFEQTNPCPNGVSPIEKADFWFAATKNGTPDYFNICNSFTTLTVPWNGFGYQFPRTGNSYGGFVTYSSPGFVPFFEFREYIENGLKQTLKPNANYCVSYFVNLAGISNYASANVGVVFSKDSIRYYSLPNSPSYVISYTPSVENTFIITDSIGWTKIEGTYLASGIERFMTIGNFRHDPLTSTLSIATNTPSYREIAYYFIDDVSVTEIVNANAAIKDTLISRCVSDSVILGTDSTWDATYAWNSTSAGLAALSCTNCPNPIAKPLVTTKYYLTKQQCSATTKDSVTVVVLTPTTQANAGNDANICPNDIMQLGTADSTAFVNYNWQFIGNSSLSCINCATPLANVQQTSEFVLQRTECNVTTSDTVKVKVDFCDILIPNIFTPNADDINDVWKFKLPTGEKLNELNVYNRWGLLVYTLNSQQLSSNSERSTLNLQWDGYTTAGIACSDGVYFYTLSYIDKKGEVIKMKGYVSLFR